MSVILTVTCQDTASLAPQTDIEPLFDGLQQTQNQDDQFTFQPLPAVPSKETSSSFLKSFKAVPTAAVPANTVPLPASAPADAVPLPRGLLKR